MDTEILNEYNKIKDKISEEEFLEKMKAHREEYDDINFMGDIDIARLIVGNYITEKNETLSDKPEHAMDNISKLVAGARDVSIIGRIMGMGNEKVFNTKKGKPGKLRNITIADDTEEIKVVFWADNLKLLKKVKEGDVIQINKVEIKDGYNGKEASLQPRSSIELLDSENYNNFPKYEEIITPISDMNAGDKVNVIGRITRIPSYRTYEKNGREGKILSMEIQDASGKTEYKLWNNDVSLIDSLELKEGDAVKILDTYVSEYNGTLSLSHRDGQIIKGDYDVPDFEEETIKIGEAHEQKDVTVMGIITKIRDTITFKRKDGSDGFVKSIDIMDDTGSIKVTFWGDDTKLDINKGEIIKISGGDIGFDEYSPSGYSLNTNWNSGIVTNLDGDDPIFDVLKEYATQIGPIKVEEVSESEDDGDEVDIIGRIISVGDVREFQRDDGTTGLVKSLNFADETGMIRLSFWDDKAEENFKVGDAYQIENARTKMGMYAVDLNIGKASRVIKLTEEQASILPSFKTLEAMIYTQKKIDELDEDDRNIRIVARIIDIQDIREFERQDGTPGLVRNIDLADDTSSIRLTLWDSSANADLEVGQAIKLENPRINYNEDRLELSISNASNILSPSEDELNNLLSYDELQEAIYKSKTIETLEDNDVNIKIEGRLMDPYGEKVLLYKCPHCKNTIEQSDDEYICNFCGEDIEKPNYVLMIPARLEDDTGDIQITFFSKLVEELLEMKLDDIVSLIEDSGDSGALEGKIEDLNGLSIEVIADVNFDEYNEENRLMPKKILSKKY